MVNDEDVRIISFWYFPSILLILQRWRDKMPFFAKSWYLFVFFFTIITNKDNRIYFSQNRGTRKRRRKVICPVKSLVAKLRRTTSQGDPVDSCVVLFGIGGALNHYCFLTWSFELKISPEIYFQTFFLLSLRSLVIIYKLLLEEFEI